MCHYIIYKTQYCYHEKQVLVAIIYYNRESCLIPANPLFYNPHLHSVQYIFCTFSIDSKTIHFYKRYFLYDGPNGTYSSKKQCKKPTYFVDTCILQIHVFCRYMYLNLEKKSEDNFIQYNFLCTYIIHFYVHTSYIFYVHTSYIFIGKTNDYRNLNNARIMSTIFF